MTIDMGFKIEQIGMKESDELISIIRDFVEKWAPDKSEEEKRTVSGWIRPYLYMKSIRNENV